MTTQDPTITTKGLHTFISRINSADVKQIKAQFDIASILYVIKQHKFYEMGGYETYHDMVKDQMTFTCNCADRYARLYAYYDKYYTNKDEYMKLMQMFGWMTLEKCLGIAKRKLSITAIKKMIDAQDAVPNRQWNFHIDEEAECLRLETLLSRHGLEITATGQRVHMTTALLSLIKDYERMDKNGTQMTLLDSADSPETEAVRLKREAAAQAQYVRKSNATKAKQRVARKQAKAA